MVRVAVRSSPPYPHDPRSGAYNGAAQDRSFPCLRRDNFHPPLFLLRRHSTQDMGRATAAHRVGRAHRQQPCARRIQRRPAGTRLCELESTTRLQAWLGDGARTQLHIYACDRKDEGRGYGMVTERDSRPADRYLRRRRSVSAAAPTEEQGT